MIRAFVDFALRNRWMVIGGLVVLTAWGIISFRNLPIEAYPDVANNYVQVITQWPGRSAEEIERQVTVPVEIQMAGIPHLTHLRSTTLAGLSSLMLIFDDNSTSDVNREHVLERLSQVNLPANLVPQMGTDWSPVGQIYWYTLESTNPAFDVMEKKSLEDWTLEKSFKGVQGVVDVSSFGGPTKEYQIKLDRRQQQQRRRQFHRARRAANQRAIRRPLHQRAGHREHRRQDHERHGHQNQGYRHCRARSQDSPRTDRQSHSPRRRKDRR
jgi:cobalt-zinc-cadmium resistance protein CzcA